MTQIHTEIVPSKMLVLEFKCKKLIKKKKQDFYLWYIEGHSYFKKCWTTNSLLVGLQNVKEKNQSFNTFILNQLVW